MSVITPVIGENTVFLGHINLSPYLLVSDLHITMSISRHIEVSAGQVLCTIVLSPHPSDSNINWFSHEMTYNAFTFLDTDFHPQNKQIMSSNKQNTKAKLLVCRI